MFGTPPSAHPFEFKARRRSRKASSEQGSTKPHSFSASSNDTLSRPPSIASQRPNDYASDIVTSPTSICELESPGPFNFHQEVVTLSISTKSRSLSSGFSYNDDLFNWGIPPTKWSTFTQEIIKAVRKDAVENANGDIFAPWVLEVSLKLPFVADAGESQQGEGVEQKKNDSRKKSMLSNLGWKRDVPEDRKFRIILTHTRTMSGDQARTGAPRPTSELEKQDAIPAGRRKLELVADLPVGGKGHEVELEATEVPLTLMTSSIRDTAELSYLSVKDGSGQSWSSMSS
ncbi:hypothetical protein GJ744_000011 [Endocarpon pusillum]|uniref:Uncharacterized protein n=1 Tax=Endocarpon pusillum TaxID=364733 RepID=A0A8H7EBZ1_9EURO|nr:hypothetical protein GJ744_000011 [Endocarpon pusillum]